MHRRHIAFVLLLLQLEFHGLSCSVSHQQCPKDEVFFETILRKTKHLDCTSGEADHTDCTLMHRLNELAQKESKDLKKLIKQVTVAVIISSQLTAQLREAWNTSLDVRVSRHLAFVGSMTCLNGNAELCNQIKNSCSELSSQAQHHIFLVSGYCSEFITCAPIATQVDLNGKPTLSADQLSYIAFRLLERQLFIAKEMDEVQVTLSAESEYSIQKDLQDTYGSQLVNDRTPVAMFVAWPVKTSAYYQAFSMFLDSALTLKKLFAFHVVTTRLGKISQQSKRPHYRYELEDHQAFLGLYSKEICLSKATWPFSCKPIVATADMLLTSQQFSGFMLHEMLKQLSKTNRDESPTPFPAFAKSNAFLEALVRHSDSYILAVVPTEDSLKDSLLDWDKLKDLLAYLGAVFSLTFYPAVVTKPVSLDLLAQVNSGLNLSSDSCEALCFVIRMPGGGYKLLGTNEPVVSVEASVVETLSSGEWYHTGVRQSLENVGYFSTAELPRRMTACGHFVGSCETGSDYSSDGEKKMSDESASKGFTDAFVEQSNFNEVYNTTGVLVVEKSKELLSGFLNRVAVDKPWLVLFTMPWNPVCKAARSMWSAVDQCVKRLNLHDIQLAKVDCFEAKEICDYLGIDSYPTVITFKRNGRISNYTGPITTERMCVYANLALTPHFLHSQSSQETQGLVAKFLPLMSRVFVYSGSRIPDSVLDVSTEMRFREAFVFEQVPEAEYKEDRFTAFYHQSQPASLPFEGDINNTQGLRRFITNGHLDNTIFPCSWIYLTQALNSTRPLISLLSTATMTEHLTLLRHLGDEFIQKGASVCHLQLRRLSNLDDLVQRIAGHSLPTLVVLPADRRLIHRLALGPIQPDSLTSEATAWIQKVLGEGTLPPTDVQPVDKPGVWVPFGRVYNFVDPIYNPIPPKAGSKHPMSAAHRTAGGRPSFAADQLFEATELPVSGNRATEHESVPSGGTPVRVETMDHDEL